MLKKFISEIFLYKPYKIKDIDYESYWEYRKESGKSGIKSRDIAIENLIEEGSSVLDIGCGNGRLLEYLISMKKIRGEGYDNSEVALNIAQKKGLKVTKIDLDRIISLEQKYDYIIMSDIIEHLQNPENLLRSVKDSFYKSLIITFPNIGHFTYRLRLLFGKFPECWKWHPGEHIRFWTKKDFQNWILRKDNNFDGLYIKQFLSGESIPNINLLTSLTSLNYLVEIGNKNGKKSF